MRASLLLAVACAGVPVSSLAAEPSPGPGTDVEITEFVPASGTLRPGDAAVSTVVVRNNQEEELRLWIGYSVQDPGGRWHDVDPHSISLEPGKESEPQRKAWKVPQDALEGSYRVVMAVWSAPPGVAGAMRLARAHRPSAFVVASPPQPLVLGGVRWRRGNHPLGRGRVRPGGVVTTADWLQLHLDPRRCDGAEVMTDERYVRGEFSARLRTPAAPGSLTGFFLYEGVPGGNDEIDLEIFNDGSRKVLLTTWIAGEVTHQTEVQLPFDPSAGMHEYTIRRTAGSVSFWVDGKRLRTWTSRLPAKPMRLALNTWWPVWLECGPPTGDGFLLVESVRIR